jgi:hypothetical protein
LCYTMVYTGIAKKGTSMKKLDKSYDDGLDRLLDVCAQDLLDWIAGKVVFVGRRTEEFECEKIEAGIVLEGVGEDYRVLLHIAAQGTPDTTMAENVLMYNVLVGGQYDCPVMSYVLYLKKGEEHTSSPLQWFLPDGSEVLSFYYEERVLSDYSSDTLFATGLKGILPLIPFTADGARREVVEEIIAHLLPAHDAISKDLLVLTYLFASLAFDKDDQTNQDGLMRRFATLQDTLQDVPAFQQILEMGRQEEQ